MQELRAVALSCLLLMALTQQVCAVPVGGAPRSEVSPVRRVARMTPLWRIMNSKPPGAFCQNNYECSSALCRSGHCSTSHRSLSEA